uniref:Putative secreted protein n=1 Tax=Anopheles darlingi TaxID=43151 RepID=A0A2M4DGT7_ANODA
MWVGTPAARLQFRDVFFLLTTVYGVLGAAQKAISEAPPILAVCHFDLSTCIVMNITRYACCTLFASSALRLSLAQCSDCAE